MRLAGRQIPIANTFSLSPTLSVCFLFSLPLSLRHSLSFPLSLHLGTANAEIEVPLRSQSCQGFPLLSLQWVRIQPCMPRPLPAISSFLTAPFSVWSASVPRKHRRNSCHFSYFSLLLLDLFSFSFPKHLLRCYLR